MRCDVVNAVNAVRIVHTQGPGRPSQATEGQQGSWYMHEDQMLFAVCERQRLLSTRQNREGIISHAMVTAL